MTADRLQPYGWSSPWQEKYAALATNTSVLGRVIRQDRGHAVVVTADGTHTFPVRAERTGAVLVGDWVMVDEGSVREILARTSLLVRQDPRAPVAQPLVANVDIVLVVCGGDRPRRAGRVERAVTQAREAGATPVIVLTKSDLVDDVPAALQELSSAVPGVEVCSVSSATGENVETLAQRLAGSSVVFIGESGAGKSSLVNALVGDDVSAVGDVRKSDAKGRHTTTRRELHLLPMGGVLIDTPGLRALAIRADAEDVNETFTDISDLAGQCRFNDCAHDSEPGCAVRAAVERGEIDLVRLEGWRTLMADAAEVEARRQESEWRRPDRDFGGGRSRRPTS